MENKNYNQDSTQNFTQYENQSFTQDPNQNFTQTPNGCMQNGYDPNFAYQNPYAQNMGMQSVYGTPPQNESSGLSTAAMVLGIVGAVLCFTGVGGFIFGLASIIMSSVSLAKHKGGKEKAIAGLVCGIIGFAISMIIVIYTIFVAVTVHETAKAVDEAVDETISAYDEAIDEYGKALDDTMSQYDKALEDYENLFEDN